jgi:hypothetical protein
LSRISSSSDFLNRSFGVSPASRSASLQRAQWTPRQTVSPMPVMLVNVPLPGD